jgi:hypothetical protein
MNCTIYLSVCAGGQGGKPELSDLLNSVSCLYIFGRDSWARIRPVRWRLNTLDKTNADEMQIHNYAPCGHWTHDISFFL